MSQDEYEKARAQAQCSMSHLYECAQGSLWKLLWAGHCNAGARCERLAKTGGRPCLLLRESCAREQCLEAEAVYNQKPGSGDVPDALRW